MSGPVMFNDPPVRTEAMLALFRTVQRRLLLLTAVVAVLGAGVGLLVGQLPGVWGALIAALLGLVFTFTTVATLRFLAGRGPELLQLVLVGGLLVKMVLVVLVMLWLRTQDFYHRGVFFGTLVVVVLGAVVIEMYSVATARIPVVEPASDDAAHPASGAPASGVSSVTPAGPEGPAPTAPTTDPHEHADAIERGVDERPDSPENQR